MESFQDCVNEYRIQLKKGVVQKAYRGLMEYMMELRTYFEKKYPDYFVSGSLYPGYMDMTYFSFTPKSLTAQKLRIALVFIHEPMRFEAWLAGYNKQIQSRYWKIIKDSGWNKYSLVPSIQGSDSILETILAEDPGFGNTADLTVKIESGILRFITDTEDFLAALRSE